MAQLRKAWTPKALVRLLLWACFPLWVFLRKGPEKVVLTYCCTSVGGKTGKQNSRGPKKRADNPGVPSVASVCRFVGRWGKEGFAVKRINRYLQLPAPPKQTGCRSHHISAEREDEVSYTRPETTFLLGVQHGVLRIGFKSPWGHHLMEHASMTCLEKTPPPSLSVVVIWLVLAKLLFAQLIISRQAMNIPISESSFRRLVTKLQRHQGMDMAII